MAHSGTIGNIAIALITVASLVVCGAIVARWRSGAAVLELRPREACPWHPLAVWLVFPISIVVRYVVLEHSPPRGPLVLVQAMSLAMLLEIVLMMAALALSSPIRPADFGLSRTRLATDARAGFLGFVASWAPVLAVNIVVNQLHLRSKVHSLFDVLLTAPGAETVLWIVLTAALLAPLTEELLYRVVLQGWFETRIGPRAAIVFVSSLFALNHYEPGKPDWIPLFPLALILGYVYYRLHSYVAVAVLHAAFNATNLALALMIRPELPG